MQGEQAGAKPSGSRGGPKGGVACLLCPHHCLIADGGHGVCGVRFNRGGGMELPYYGKVTRLSRSIPSRRNLSIISIPVRASSRWVSWAARCAASSARTVTSPRALARTPVRSAPRELVEAARKERSFGIAYTYSEPLVHFEYVMDAARLAREAGLKNVLVSNGYLDPEPAEEILGLMDAANIDLKAFDPDFYRSETGGTWRR